MDVKKNQTAIAVLINDDEKLMLSEKSANYHGNELREERKVHHLEWVQASVTLLLRVLQELGLVGLT